ncbi:MAG TPA: hypothetical protein VFS41_02000 [Edaphobacter sp.]|nr:hypothetical protein [Edaphobacter sp.]
MMTPVSLSVLRRNGWRGVPSDPGVYWWYFPVANLQHLKINDFCSPSELTLRVAPDGKVCLYHGLANNLAERVRWHAAQKLTLNNLQSGYLSTFRLTLLVLNQFDYRAGAESIDAFFDELSISWLPTKTRIEAENVERMELGGNFHYPLNIAGNSCPELRHFLRHLKAARSEYKHLYLSREH